MSDWFYGDKTIIDRIGGAFVLGKFELYDCVRSDVFSISPVHGRSAVHVDRDYNFTSIKGSGWSFGGPLVLQSPKDPELYFGLYGQKVGIREVDVSNRLRSAGIRCGRSSALTLIADESYRELCFLNGSRVNPALLYTEILYPLRVADLAFLDPIDRLLAISEAGEKMKFIFNSARDFVIEFICALADTVQNIHRLGGVYDSLTYDNVTLAAEIVDFEWFYLPGFPNPDGSTDQELCQRQKKVKIYIIEVSYQLAALLNVDLSFFEIESVILDRFPADF